MNRGVCDKQTHLTQWGNDSTTLRPVHLAMIISTINKGETKHLLKHVAWLRLRNSECVVRVFGMTSHYQTWQLNLGNSIWKSPCVDGLFASEKRWVGIMICRKIVIQIPKNHVHLCTVHYIPTVFLQISMNFLYVSHFFPLFMPCFDSQTLPHGYRYRVPPHAWKWIPTGPSKAISSPLVNAL